MLLLHVLNLSQSKSPKKSQYIRFFSTSDNGVNVIEFWVQSEVKADLALTYG